VKHVLTWQGNDDPSRIGDAANPLLHGSQLSTEIGFGDGGVRVRDLSRAHNKSNHDKTNKALQSAYGPTAETAKMLYKMTDDAKLFKGKSQDAIIAGCIFIACRKHDQQRSFREIFKMTNVSKKEVGRTFKILEAFIQKSQNSGPSVAGNGAVIDTVNLLNQKGGTTAMSAASLMPRACAKLALPTQVQLVAEECADQVAHYGVAAGRSPLSIAGACLYLVSHLMGHPKSPKEIGTAVEVSDGTIRTAYKLMHQEQDKIIKDSWFAKGGDRSRIPAA
jgi:transcription initiation factor TFIIB